MPQPSGAFAVSRLRGLRTVPSRLFQCLREACPSPTLLGNRIFQYSPSTQVQVSLKTAGSKLQSITDPSKLSAIYTNLGLEPPYLGPLSPGEVREETIPLKEAILRKEGALIARLNVTLKDLVSLYTVNRIAGFKKLSLEELKPFLLSENPSRAYLSTLCWWRKALSFLLLYLFILPSTRLIFYGSSQSKGASQNICDALINLATDGKKWRACVNNLFSVTGDAIFEYAAISRRYNVETASGKTFEVFRQEELEKRLLEHGYDSAEIHRKFNGWLIKTLNIRCDIPLLGPIIDTLIKSCLASSLGKESFPGQLLSLIKDSGQYSANPAVYQLLNYISYLINQGRELLKTRYEEDNSEPEIDMQDVINFTPHEQQLHLRALENLEELPYAMALSLQQVNLLNTNHHQKLDESQKACWPHVKSTIATVAEDGAVLLLRLFTDATDFAHMRIAILEKILSFLHHQSLEISPEAFTEVHKRVSSNALETISLALEHEFSDRRINERYLLPYKYATKLVVQMQLETSEALDALSANLHLAYSLSPDWQNHVSDSFQLTIRIASMLNTRLRYLEQVPKSEPFNKPFFDKLADHLLSHAVLVEKVLAAIKLLTETALPHTRPLLITLSNIEDLLNTPLSDSPLSLPFGKRSKKYLLSLEQGLEKLNSSVLLNQIRSFIEGIELSQSNIRDASSQTDKLQLAIASLNECRALISIISSSGTDAIYQELLALSNEPLIEAIEGYLQKNAIPYDSSVTSLLKMLQENPSKNFSSNINECIKNLRGQRLKNERLLKPKQIELVSHLTGLEIADSDNYHSLQETLEITLALHEARVAQETAAIQSSRARLLDSYRDLHTALNAHLIRSQESLTTTCDELKRDSFLLKQNMNQIIAPSPPRRVEVSTLPFIGYIPKVSNLSRASIATSVSNVAETQVNLVLDFLSRTDVLAYLISSGMRCNSFS